MNNKLIRTCGSTYDNNEDILQFEKEFAIDLPSDYRKFLKENDYVNLTHNKITINIENKNYDLTVEEILGFSGKSFKLYDINVDYKDELPKGVIVIADSGDGTFLLDSNSNEILFWDDFRVIDISNEHSTVYTVASNFSEFLKKIELIEI